MTAPGFVKEIDGIRAALKRANDNLVSNKPINLTPLRDMIDGLTQGVEKQAPEMGEDLRNMLITDLSALVGELEALERLVENRLMEEKD